MLDIMLIILSSSEERPFTLWLKNPNQNQSMKFHVNCIECEKMSSSTFDQQLGLDPADSEQISKEMRLRTESSIFSASASCWC